LADGVVTGIVVDETAVPAFGGGRRRDALATRLAVAGRGRR
jgi:hypothetical protein